MSQISPPVRILLVCAVAFMAAWVLFLRPTNEAVSPVAAAPPPAATPRPADAGGAKPESLSGQAVEQANEARAAQNAQAEALAGDAGTGAVVPTAPGDPAPAPRAQGSRPGPLSKGRAVQAGLPIRVLRALAARKVVVLLFWAPKAVEDRAVRKALGRVDRHDGKVLAHAANLKRIAAYQQITRGADVTQSPTVVVIDRKRKVETLVGFVDRTTIDQAVTDALRNS